MIALLQAAESASREWRLVDVPETWILVLIILPLIAAVCFLGYRSEPISATWKATLGCLRFAAIALLCLVLFRPVVVEREELIYTVLAGTSGLGARPGHGALFSLSVLNLGNGPSVFNISCETPNRWSVELGDGNSSSLTLEPLARLQFLPVSVRVNVPLVVDGLPAAGTKEAISCTTTHTGASGMFTVESTEIEVFVSQEFTVDLYSSTGVPVGVWGNALGEAVIDGQRLNLTLDIVNKGNVPLELDVTVTPEQTTWPLALFCGAQNDPRSVDITIA